MEYRVIGIQYNLNENNIGDIIHDDDFNSLEDAINFIKNEVTNKDILKNVKNNKSLEFDRIKNDIDSTNKMSIAFDSNNYRWLIYNIRKP